MARPRFRYSPWDGTQVGFDVDAFDVMEQLTDDLLYHGDLNNALRRLLRDGFEDRNGDRIAGLREMLEQLRERRQDLLDRFDLGGVFGEISDELDAVVDLERAALDQQVADAQASGDARREELTSQSTSMKHMELEMLPSDLAGKVKGINLEVVIAVGHTDSVGADAYNQGLSVRRSEAVKAYLVSKGIEKNRVYTEGKGEKQPVADNKTSAGRAKNRRVEIEVVGTRPNR